MASIRALVRLAVIAALPLALGGCLMTLLQSYSTGGGSGFPNTLQLRVNAAQQQCTTTAAPGGTGVSCMFGVGDFRGSATVTLPGVMPAQVATWWDPLILQLPASASNFAATFAGPAPGTLSITPVTGPLFADATTPIVADPGTQLLIIDFPGGTPPAGAGTYQFTFNFSVPASTPTPLTIKALVTGKVTVGGNTYYAPLIPCTASFAAMPTITLPTANALTPINVAPLLGITGCTNVTYDFAGGAPAPTVTVVEYYHAALNHYFITWIADEIAILDAGVTIKGWTRTGQTLKAHATAQTGTSEVCRFYIPPAQGDSHFFGRGTTECNDTRAKFPTFVLEDPLYMHVFLPVAGVCPAGTTQIYRVFSNRIDANHRYMTSRALRDQMVALGWLAEGDGPDQVVMCAPV